MNNFNLFESENSGLLDEKGHTTLLKRLLNPKGMHQQWTLFLKSFITDVLHCDFDENSDWEIIQEVKSGRGRADLLIRTKDLSRVFVIENKIYGATGRQSQLYRYWRNQIYKAQEKCKKKGLNHEGKLVYLTSDGSKPNKKSLIRPYSSNEKYANLPEILSTEENVLCISYKREISKWIGSCLCAINKPRNYRLYDTLKQYKEWIDCYL